MAIQTIKRMARDILGIGGSRIKINNSEIDKVKDALTKDDVRGLIHRGLIVVDKPQGISRKNAKERHEKRKSGQKRGPGSRKGTKGARTNPKQVWMNKVRKQRETITALKPKLASGMYGKLRKMIKGGYFKSNAHVVSHIKEKGWIKNV